MGKPSATLTLVREISILDVGRPLLDIALIPTLLGHAHSHKQQQQHARQLSQQALEKLQQQSMQQALRGGGASTASLAAAASSSSLGGKGSVEVPKLPETQASYGHHLIALTFMVLKFGWRGKRAGHSARFPPPLFLSCCFSQSFPF